MRLVNPLPQSRHALERRLRAQLLADGLNLVEERQRLVGPTLRASQFRQFEQREGTFEGCGTGLGQIQRLIEVFVSLVESSSL